MENKYVDVLIVGSGVAGLYSALNLRDDLDVMVVSKDKIDCTNTSLAQGGISVARDINDVPYFIDDLHEMRRKNINFPKDGIPVVVLMTYLKDKNLGSFRFPGRITMAGTIYDTYEIDKYFDISMYDLINKLFEEEGK